MIEVRAEKKPKDNLVSTEQRLQAKFDSYYQPINLDDLKKGIEGDVAVLFAALITTLDKKIVEQSLLLFEQLCKVYHTSNHLPPELGQYLLQISHQMVAALLKSHEISISRHGIYQHVLNYILKKLPVDDHLAFYSQAGDVFRHTGSWDDALPYYASGLQIVETLLGKESIDLYKVGRELYQFKIAILEVRYAQMVYYRSLDKTKDINSIGQIFAMIDRLIFIESWQEIESLCEKIENITKKSQSQLQGIYKTKWEALKRLRRNMNGGEVIEKFPHGLSFTPIVIELRPILVKLRQAMLEGLKQQHDDIILLQRKFSNELKELVINPIIERTLQCLPASPCPFEILALGSFSYQAGGPYSDIDCALLIENEDCRYDPFFLRLIESIQYNLHCLADPWLLTSNPRAIGLHVDSGDVQDLTNKRVLCQTPLSMANWVVEQLASGAFRTYAPELAFSLLSVSTLYGSHSMYSLRDSYIKHLTTCLSQDSLDQKTSLMPSQGIALKYCKLQLDTYNRAQRLWSSRDVTDIKAVYLKPVIFWCQYMALYYRLMNEQKEFIMDPSLILERLQKTKYFRAEFIARLKHYYRHIQLLRCQLQLERRASLDEVILPIGDYKDQVSEGFDRLSLPRHILPSLSVEQHNNLLQQANCTIYPLYQDLTAYVDYFLGRAFQYDPLDMNMQFAIDAWKKGAQDEAAEQKLKAFINQLVGNFSYAEVGVHYYGDAYMLCPEPFQEWFITCIQQQEVADRLADIMKFIELYPKPDGSRIGLERAEKKWKVKLKALVWEDNAANRNNYIQLLPNYPIIRVKGVFLDEGASSHLLHPHIVKVLIDPKHGGFYEQKRHLLRGRRIVIPATSGEFAYHFKAWPELPGIGLAADILLGYLTGRRWWSDVWRFEVVGGKSYPVLISETVLGESFQDRLDNQMDEAFEDIPINAFTQLIFAALLLNFGNAKPDSFINSLDPIMIDTDQAFLKPSGENTYKTRGKVTSSQSIQVICFLFYLDLMKQKLDVQAVKLFLRLNPSQVLSLWLSTINSIDIILNKIFSQQDQLQYFKSLQGDWTYIPLNIRPDLIAELYHKMINLQSYLIGKEITLYGNDTNPVTHIDVFKHIDPVLYTYHELSLQEGKTPNERFTTLVKDIIDRQALAAISTFEGSSWWQNILPPYTPPKILHEKLISIHEGYQKIDEARRGILNRRKPRYDAFLSLPDSYNCEQVINAIEFKDMPDQEEREILRVIQNKAQALPTGFQQLHLPFCKTLNDQQIKAIMSKTACLVTLDLTGCVLLSFDVLRQLIEQMKFLRELKLGRLEKITRLGPLLGYLDTPSLTRLSLTQCSALNQIKLNAPKLVHADLSQCQLLNSVYIKADQVEELYFQKCRALYNVYVYSNGIRFTSFSGCRELTLDKLAAFIKAAGSNITKLELTNCTKIDYRWSLENHPDLAEKFSQLTHMILATNRMLFTTIDSDLDIKKALIILSYQARHGMGLEKTMAGLIYSKLGYYKAAKICCEEAKNTSKLFSRWDPLRENLENAIALHTGNTEQPSDEEFISEIVEHLAGFLHALRTRYGDDDSDTHSEQSESNAYGLIRQGEYHLGLQMLVQVLGINRPDVKGITPLTYAVSEGNMPILNYLLSQGADPNDLSNAKFPVIVYAIASSELKFDSKVAIINKLLKAGANINILGKNGTPLITAVSIGTIEMVVWLIEHGADIRKGIGNLDALGFAIKLAKEEIANLLLSYLDKAKIINTDYYHNLVCTAVTSNNFSILGKLLGYGHRIDYLDQYNRSILHFGACKNKSNDTRVFEYLLAHPSLGRLINHQNNYGNSPLLVAACLGTIEHVHLLKRCGAEIQRVNFKGDSALFLSLLTGDKEKIEYFIQQGNILTRTQKEILDCLTNYGANQAMIECLPKCPIQAVAVEKDKVFPYSVSNTSNQVLNATFLYAIQYGFHKTVEALVENSRIIVDYRDVIGATALYYAVENKPEEGFIKKLLKLGYHPRCFYNNVTLRSLSTCTSNTSLINLIENAYLVYLQEAQAWAYTILVHTLLSCSPASDHALLLADVILADAFPELEARHIKPNPAYINTYFVNKFANYCTQPRFKEFLRQHLYNQWEPIMLFLEEQRGRLSVRFQAAIDSEYQIKITLAYANRTAAYTEKNIMLLIQKLIYKLQGSASITSSQLENNVLLITIPEDNFLYYRTLSNLLHCLNKFFPLYISLQDSLDDLKSSATFSVNKGKVRNSYLNIMQQLETKDEISCDSIDQKEPVKQELQLSLQTAQSKIEHDLIEMLRIYQMDFSVQASKYLCVLALPKPDDPRYDMPLFATSELLVNTLEELGRYLKLTGRIQWSTVSDNELYIVPREDTDTGALLSFLKQYGLSTPIEIAFPPASNQEAIAMISAKTSSRTPAAGEYEVVRRGF